MRPNIYPNARILRVYGYDETDEESLSKRGMVKIDLEGFMTESYESEESREEGFEEERRQQPDAVLIYPYGFMPSTDENQVTTAIRGHPMNQNYGFVAPPRRGDKVIAMNFGDGRWVVLGARPTTVAAQPPHSIADLSFVHRSGSSIRFNDRFPSSMSDPWGSVDDFENLSGHLTSVGNRMMWLGGTRFLPHGLMSDYEKHQIQIDIREVVAGETEITKYDYSQIFDNTDSPALATYYEPWTTTMGTKKFLRPPSIDEGMIMLHHGGGMIKISDSTAGNMSHLKMGARGVTIYVGEEYWNAGLRDETTHVSGVDSTVEDDVIKIVHPSGVIFRIDAAGVITVGTKTKQAIGHGDLVTKHPTVNLFGALCYDQAAGPGHEHTSIKSQDEVWIP